MEDQQIIKNCTMCTYGICIIYEAHSLCELICKYKEDWRSMSVVTMTVFKSQGGQVIKYELGGRE